MLQTCLLSIFSTTWGTVNWRSWRHPLGIGRKLVLLEYILSEICRRNFECYIVFVLLWFQSSKGFVAHFYAVSETVSPMLAWGFLGPEGPLKDMCYFFKVSDITVVHCFLLTVLACHFIFCWYLCSRDLRSFVIRFDSYWWSDSKFSNRPRCQSSFVKKRLVVVKFAFKVDFGSKISVHNASRQHIIGL